MRKKPAASVRQDARGGHAAAVGVRQDRAALRHGLALGVVIVFAFLAYANSFNAPFLFDNNEIILQDTRVHAVTADHIRAILTGPYWEIRLISLYRPLTTLSYLFNYAALGNAANPAMYHWVNFGLHAVNISLVYALGTVLFGELPQALLLSLLWGVHPALTESVTNIVGRADLLAAFGVLASVLAYHQALRSSGRRRAAWLAAAGLATGIGIFSKESAIVVLAVLVLYDVAFARGVPWRRRWPGYVAVAVPCLFYFPARVFALRHVPYTPVPFVDNPLVAGGFLASRLTAIKVIGKYLLLLAWPAHLSCDYSYNAIPLFGWNLARWQDWQAILSLLVCLAAAGLAAYFYRRNPRILFGIGLFFIALAPTSNIALLIGTIMGERFLYLPAVGFIICVVCLLEAVRGRLRATRPGLLAASVVAALAIALAVRTYQRNGDWNDEDKLWSTAVQAAPGSYKPHLMYAIALQRLGAPAGSHPTAEMDRAMSILATVPDNEIDWTAYREAGIFYRVVGTIAASEKPGDSSKPGPEFWYRKALTALGRAERILRLKNIEHRQAYAKAGKPGLTFLVSSIYLEMGRCYMALSDRSAALAAFEQGRAIESNPDILEELAAIYQQDGNLRGAAKALVEALYIDPSRTQLGPKLVELYGKIDAGGCSVTGTGGRRDLNLECPLLHADVCGAAQNVVTHYLQHGMPDEAAKSLKIARDEVGCNLPEPH